MLHDEWFELISAGADGQLSDVEATELDAHLGTCEPCADLLRSLERDRRRHRLQSVRAPGALAGRVTAARDHERALADRARSRLVHRGLVATGVVAAAMIAFVSMVRAPGSTPPPPAQPSGSQVMIDAWNRSFDRAEVSVPAGTTVEWRNAGAATHHLVRHIGGATIADDLRPGQSEEATFSRPGTYHFACTIHPDMTGTVTVDA